MVLIYVVRVRHASSFEELEYRATPLVTIMPNKSNHQYCTNKSKIVIPISHCVQFAGMCSDSACCSQSHSKTWWHGCVCRRWRRDFDLAVFTVRPRSRSFYRSMYFVYATPKKTSRLAAMLVVVCLLSEWAHAKERATAGLCCHRNWVWLVE